MTLRLLFHSNQLSLRGTEVALHDYALHAQTLLGHDALIAHQRSNPGNDPAAVAKFASRFEVLSYDGPQELDCLIASHQVDALYTIKAGRPDGVQARDVPTLVHAVFPTAPWHVHGNAFAFISRWLSEQCSGGKVPFVPHMVYLPDVEGDLREELGIPPQARVFGAYGGAQSFDVPCARSAVQQAVKSWADMHFVFMNIDPFVDHPRVRFLPGTADMSRKVRFIQTCDAMLHARMQGESFGLACGEFSIRQRPVLTYAGSKHRHHIDVLGERGLLYRDEQSLLKLLGDFDPAAMRQRDWDCYSQHYGAEPVMRAFDAHLLKPGLAGRPARESLALSVGDRLRFLVNKLGSKVWSA